MFSGNTTCMENTSSKNNFGESEGKVKATCGIRTAIEAAELARAISSLTYKRSDWQMRLLAMLGWNSNNNNINISTNATNTNQTIKDVTSTNQKMTLPLTLQNNSPFSVFISSPSSSSLTSHYQNSNSNIVSGGCRTNEIEGESASSIERVYNAAYNDFLTIPHKTNLHTHKTENERMLFMKNYNTHYDDKDVQLQLFQDTECVQFKQNDVEVDIPDDYMCEQLKQVAENVYCIRPRQAVSFDDYLRLIESANKPHIWIRQLNFSGVLDPHHQPATSANVLMEYVKLLEERYPVLPNTTRGNRAEENDNDDGGQDEYDANDMSDSDNGDITNNNKKKKRKMYNAALHACCTELSIPYTSYLNALNALAIRDLRVFYKLCALLSKTPLDVYTLKQREKTMDWNKWHTSVSSLTDSVQVLDLSSNRLGCESVKEPGTVDETPLRALAHLLDVNGTLQVINMSDNHLGPRGVGLLAKALTKNIAIKIVDFSCNDLNTESLPGNVENTMNNNSNNNNKQEQELREEDEAELEEEEIALFGEVKEGLEALGELLTKNKFIRVLRLSNNGIHSGETLTEDNAETIAEEKNEMNEIGIQKFNMMNDLNSSNSNNNHENTGDNINNDNNNNDHNNGKRSDSKKMKQVGGNDNVDELRGLIRKVNPKLPVYVENWKERPLWRLLHPLLTCHRLEVLDLSRNQLRDRGTHMLAIALEHNKSIRVLDLSDNNITHVGLASLAVHVLASPSTQLQSLILRRNQFAGKHRGAKSAKIAPSSLLLNSLPPSVSHGTGNVNSLTSMQFTNTLSKQHKFSATLQAMQTFAQALKVNLTLKQLIISENYLGPALSVMLMSTIAELTSLEELDFAYNNACGTHENDFDCTFANVLASALYADNNNYNKSNNNTTEGKTHLRLRRLWLDGNNLRREGVCILFPDRLSLPHYLQELHVSRNALDNTALAFISNALCACTSLHTLDLSYNSISDGVNLIRGLRCYNSTVSLNLSHNLLGGDINGGKDNSTNTEQQQQQQQEEKGKGEGNDANSNYEEKEVNESQLAHFAEFMSHVASLPNLEKLDLRGNNFSCAHGEVLCEVLTQTTSTPSLKVLDLRSNPQWPAQWLLRKLPSLLNRPLLRSFHATFSPIITKSYASHTSKSFTMGDGSQQKNSNKTKIKELNERTSYKEACNTAISLDNNNSDSNYNNLSDYEMWSKYVNVLHQAVMSSSTLTSVECEIKLPDLSSMAETLMLSSCSNNNKDKEQVSEFDDMLVKVKQIYNKLTLNALQL